MTAVLHPFVAGYRTEDQRPCWDGLIKVREHFTVKDISLLRDDSMGWPRVLRRLWGYMDLIIVEHDMEVSLDHITELSECEWQHCAFAYKLHVPHSSVGADGKYAQFVKTKHHHFAVDEGAQFADQVGFGLTKINASSQQVPFPDVKTWRYMDSDVSTVVRDSFGPWHLHWPEVVHHHRCDPARFVFDG